MRSPVSPSALPDRDPAFVPALQRDFAAHCALFFDGAIDGPLRRVLEQEALANLRAVDPTLDLSLVAEELVAVDLSELKDIVFQQRVVLAAGLHDAVSDALSLESVA